jgi:hypothetical protein
MTGRRAVVTCPTSLTQASRARRTPMSDFYSTPPIDSRPIPGHPGYAILDGGELWSCWNNRGRMTNVWHARRPPKPDRKGYLRIELRGKIRRYVHDLVLEVFVGLCPPGLEGCHNDGDPGNNFVTNLRWDTQENNQADKIKHGRFTKGERVPGAVLKESDIPEIFHQYSLGLTHREIAEIFGINKWTIGSVLQRKSWAHVPIPDEYLPRTGAI